MTGHHRHTTLPVDYGLAHRPCKEEATYNLVYRTVIIRRHLTYPVKVRTKSEVSLDRYLKRGEGLPEETGRRAGVSCSLLITPIKAR